MSAIDRLVDDYLEQLESELAGVPRAGRREVLDEIEAHISEASAELPTDDQAGMRNVLDRLGEPAEIAAEVRERFGVKRSQTTWWEIGALILLPFAWIAGVVLLWISDAWSTRDKLIGTLVLPGGYAAALFFFLLAFVEPDSAPAAPAWAIARVVLFGGLLVLPLVVDGYLLLRLRERTA